METINRTRFAGLEGSLELIRQSDSSSVTGREEKSDGKQFAEQSISDDGKQSERTEPTIGYEFAVISDTTDNTDQSGTGTAKRKRGRPPGSKNKTTQTSNSRTSKQEKQHFVEQASLLLDLMSTFAENSLGQDAAINKTERSIIEPALARTLERYSPENIEAVSKYLDPVMILVGFSMYAFRMRSVVVNQKPVSKPVNKSVDKPETVTKPSQAQVSRTPKPAPVNKEDLDRWISSA